MKIRFKNQIILFLIAVIISQPLFVAAQAKAADTSTSTNSTAADEVTEIDGSIDVGAEVDPKTGLYAVDNEVLSSTNGLSGLDNGELTGKNSTPEEILSIWAVFQALMPDGDMSIPLDKKLSGNMDKKIIMNYDDLDTVKALYCLAGSEVMPDLSNDFAELYKLWPDVKKKMTDEDLAQIKVDNQDDLLIVKVENPQVFNNLIHFSEEIWATNNKDLIANDPSTIACVTKRSLTEVSEVILNKDSDADTYNAMISATKNATDSMKVDTRVLNTLIYLVTPKNQGGAGHYRITVNRLLSGYTNPKKIYSRESNSIKSDSGATAATDAAGEMTAADLGMQRGTTSTTTSQSDLSSVALVSDTDGTTYDAYLAKSENAEIDNAAKANISAHADGEAIDISEVDDIRCTLIKKKRIGGTSKSKSSQRPIKLAWQTTEGYQTSGGENDYQTDLANTFRQLATDSLTDLVNNLGGDVTDYQGDLSNASFSDIATLIGKSLFSQILNSPSVSLKGISMEDTLTKMGGMYFADFLGLPRELFLNAHFSDYDSFSRVIGQAAIEERLKLPLGSLSGDSVSELLIKVGQRKLELEMNLDAGSLDAFAIYDEKIANTKTLIVGQAVIEQSLNLDPGSFTGKNIQEIRKSLGKLRGELLFNSPEYMDNTLHIDPGTTAKLKNGTMSVHDYIVYVGQTRFDDTAYGLQNMAASDSLYELEPGTWNSALTGNTESIANIGIDSLAKTFTDTADQRLAFKQWVSYEDNSAAGPEDATTCEIADPLIIHTPINTYKKDSSGKILYGTEPNGTKYPLIDTTTYKDIEISQSKATSIGLYPNDMQRIFGCPQNKGGASAVFQRTGDKILFYAMANYSLNPDDKVKMDLTEVNPQIHSDNPEYVFYLQRVLTIRDVIKRIESNWSDDKTDAEYAKMQRVIKNSISSINNDILMQTTDITSIEGIKNSASKFAPAIDGLKTTVVGMKGVAYSWTNKIDGTIGDVNQLVLAVSEIFEGKAIPSAQQIKLKTIPTNVFTQKNSNTSSLSSSKKVQANKTGMILLLAKKVAPKDLFFAIGSEQVESELNLPTNSLRYFVQNYESKGIGALDSFLTAIGQAQIEQELGMPSAYFQGPILKATTGMPDFANDIPKLWYYTSEKNAQTFKLLSDANLTTLKDSFTSGAPKVEGSTTLSLQTLNLSTSSLLSIKSYNTIDEYFNQVLKLNQLKSSDPKSFAGLVNDAKNAYRDEMTTFVKSAGGNSAFETGISDVVDNIKRYKLADGIRDPETDLLTRFGFLGSNLASLKDDGSSAWRVAEARSIQIDKKLGIKEGSTKNLFTGKAIGGEIAKQKLTQEEKQLLSAKMGVQISSIDLLLKVLNGEEDPSVLNSKNTVIAFSSDNPYAVIPADVNPCQAYYEQKDGNFVSNYAVKDSFLYIDQDGTHYFANRNEAQSYSEKHSDKRMTVIEELAAGVGRLNGSNDLTMNLTSLNQYITGKTEIDPNFGGLSDDKFDEIERNTGITKDLINKLFTKAEASDATRPLVAYKKAVGLVVAKRAISYRLFEEFGLNIDPSVFGFEQFFQVLSGDMSPLIKIGASMIEANNNLPKGIITNFLLAPNNSMRQCSLAEIGANTLGRYVGLNSVSLKGNIYQNIGRAKIEQTLGLQKNSFYGNNIDELIKNVGPARLALALHAPIGDVLNRDLLDKSSLQSFFSPQYSASIAGSSPETKLKQIQSYVESSSRLSQSELFTYGQINDVLTYDLKQLFDPNQAWWADGYKPETNSYGERMKSFLSYVKILDGQFNLSPGITKAMITGQVVRDCNDVVVTCDASDPACKDGKKVVNQCVNNARVTPDEYVDKVAKTTTLSIATSTIIDNLSDEDYTPEQKKAMKDIASNFAVYTKTNQHYGDIYDDLSKIFTDYNLDKKADFEPGTMRAVLNNPSEAGSILFPQFAKQLDDKLKLNPNVSGSFSQIYKKYTVQQATTAAAAEQKQKECNAFMLTPERDAQLTAQEQAINDKYRNQATDAEVAPDDVFTPGYGGTIRETNQSMGHSQEDASALAAIAGERANADNSYNACKSNSRDGTGKLGVENGSVSDWASKFFTLQNGLAMVANEFADNIQTEITKATKGTILMPQEDITKIITKGDMRYAWAASMAYAANTIVDKINPDQKNAVPPALRIDYSDLLLWVMGDSTSEKYASDAAAASVINKTTNANYDSSFITYRYGDVCNGGFGGTFAGCMLQTDFTPNSTGLPRSYDTLTQANQQTLAKMYKVDPSNFDRAALKTTLTNLDRDAKACTATLSTYSNKFYATNSTDVVASMMSTEQEVDKDPAAVDCQDKIQLNNDVKAAQSSAVNQSRQMFKDDVQFRMLDSVFYGRDKNVFPGFAYALFKGDAHTRSVALSMYVKNGIVNGEFFGTKIDFLKDIHYNDLQALGAATNFISSLSSVGSAGKDGVFDKFVSSGGYNTVTSYLADHSEQYFGTKIDLDLFKGLVTGISTGNWGFDGMVPIMDSKYTSADKKVQTVTLGAYGIDKLKTVTFAWGDKQLGLDPGTSQQIYEYGKTAYQTYAMLRDIDSINSAKHTYDAAYAAYKTSGDITDVTKTGADWQAERDKHPEAASSIDKNGEKGAAKAAKQQITQMAVQLATQSIMRWINSKYGEQIGLMEERWGLVPGSTQVLISYGVGLAVGYTTEAIGLLGHSAFMSAFGPAAFWGALAMFVVMNLFGVYKIEVKCSADGYFPSMEKPDPGSVDFTGLGVWDGKNQETNTTMTVKAAQYKARRLAQDVLEMNKNPRYKDTIPNQIMTGRNEDALALNNVVTQNVCHAYSKTASAIAGICEGNTRVGIWSNPQTTAYTHIGF